jgi:hypothetical protein
MIFKMEHTFVMENELTHYKKSMWILKLNQNTIVPWPFQHMSVEWIINFEIFISKRNILKYSLFSFTIFFDLEKINFQNFNISEYDIISVKLATVLGYYLWFAQSSLQWRAACVWENDLHYLGVSVNVDECALPFTHFHLHKDCCNLSP